MVNLNKSELEPKQVFDFVGYQYDLNQGVVRPTPQRWQNLNNKIHLLLGSRTCSVRQIMSLIGLLMATEKQVGMASHEALSVASKMELAYPRIPGEVHSNSNLSPSSPSVVATGGKCHPGTALAPITACPSNIY